MKPPKCRSCGKEEWRHVCGPLKVLITEKAPFAGSTAPGSVNRVVGHIISVPQQETVTPNAQTVTRASKGGRGKKVHTTGAAKQAAYRARKKAQA